MIIQLRSLNCHYIVVTRYCVVNAVSLAHGGVMDEREQKGEELIEQVQTAPDGHAAAARSLRVSKAMELVERGRVVRDQGGWIVWSLNSSNRYRVTLDP